MAFMPLAWIKKPVAENKRDKKHFVFYAVITTVITAVLPLPAAALSLPLSFERGTLKILKTEPDYSDRMGGTLRGQHSIKITEGQWPKQGRHLSAKNIPAAAVIYPSANRPIVLEGEASFYSRDGCLGCSPALTMANGQALDDNALTMAIGADKKHLVGYRALVTSLATGKSVEVKITDTGGFYQNQYGQRVADLTKATKQAIGMAGGVGQVRVEVY